MHRSVLALLFASVLLLAYFYVIDPTVQNRQGNDRGSQYQTGVYFTNESARETVKRIAEIERGRSEKFFVEIGPLKNFYPAEEYHQNYLEKNPNGYCHIPRAEMELFSRLRIDPGDYQKPAAETPISVMCSPAIRSRPTACATASTARPCASFPMKKWRPRVTDTCCTCLKNRTQTVGSSHARNYQHITAYRTATGQSDML